MKLNEIKSVLAEQGKNNATTLELLSSLDYKPTTKKKIEHKRVEDVTLKTLDKMPKSSFAYAAEDFTLKTITSDGIDETVREVPKGAIIICGQAGEKYYPTEKDLKKNWSIHGDTAFPEQNERMVSHYNGKRIDFWPPWTTDKKMPLLPGDYVVREAEGKFYRIGKKEYELSYNPPGKKG